MKHDFDLAGLSQRQIRTLAIGISGGDGSSDDGDVNPLVGLLETLDRVPTAEQIAAGTLPENPLTDEEIAETEAAFLALFDEIRAEAVSVENVAAMNQIDEAVTRLRVEGDRRETEAADLQAQADEIAGRVIRSEDGDEDPAEADPAADPAEADPADPADPAEAEPAEAIGEPVGAGVTAAATPTPLHRLAARRPARHAPRPATTQPRGPRMLAGDGVGGVGIGGEFSGWSQVSEAFSRVHDQIARGSSTDGSFVPIVSIRPEYPEDRRVSAEFTPQQNAAIVASAMGLEDLQALTASGGLCAPVGAYYEQAHIGDNARPVRASLPGFQADRGGIRFVAPVGLSTILADQASAAITTVSMTQDLASKAKTKQTFSCPGVTEVDVTAIADRLGFGNVLSRTFPERVQNILEVTQDMVSRVAERRLLTTIGAGSTTVVSPQAYGAARDLFGDVAVAAAGYRNRHRMDFDAIVEVIMPAWVRDQFLVDITNSLASEAEFLQWGVGQVDAFFARARVNVTWAREGEAAAAPQVAQDWPAQAGLGAGLRGFPTEAIWYMFHSGAWLFLDGGELNLGLTRDSTLNSTNDYEIMYELFEDVAFVGLESLKVRSTVCASGISAGSITTETCAASPGGFGS